MLKCKEAARILSSEEKLSFLKRAELKFHLFMCAHCKNYEIQMKRIVDGLKLSIHNRSKIDPKKLKKLEEDIIKKCC